MSVTQYKVSRYGWIRDIPDHRDLIYNNLNTVLHASQVPNQYDLSDEMSPIYNQLNLGSCTANATAGVMQHMQMKEGEAEGNDIPSRLFIYYNERKIEGLPLDQDTGAQVRDGIKTLATIGAPPESDWPYSDNNPGAFQEEPPQSAFNDALKYEAVQYKRIVIPGPGAPMRTAIYNHFPIAFGFPVPDLFEDPSWNPATQYLPLPTPENQIIGGHAVVVVGYDWTCTRFPVPVFKIRNSWGPEWGDNGHFYMQWDWFDPWRNLANDMWIVEKVS